MVSTSSLPATRFASRCALALPAAAGYRPRYASSRDGVAPVACKRERRSSVARVSSPGESHPHPHSEPYVSLSTHTAPIIQTP